MSRLNTGGTQYYILFLVKALKQSINSKVLVMRKKDLDHKMLKKNIQFIAKSIFYRILLIFLSLELLVLFSFFGINRSKIKDFLSNQKIHVTCPLTYFVLKNLLPRKNLNKISYGVYHAKSFSWGRDGNLTCLRPF